MNISYQSDNASSDLKSAKEKKKRKEDQCFSGMAYHPRRPRNPGGGGGGGVLPYKGLMGTCGQPGYVFRDFCLEQGIEFIIFCLNQGIDLSIFVLNWVN